MPRCQIIRPFSKSTASNFPSEYPTKAIFPTTSGEELAFKIKLGVPCSTTQSFLPVAKSNANKWPSMVLTITDCRVIAALASTSLATDVSHNKWPSN